MLEYFTRSLNNSIQWLSYWNKPDPFKNESNFKINSYDKSNNSYFLQPNCLDKIEFDYLNFKEIKEQIKKTSICNHDIELIINIINHYEKNQDSLLLKQMDWFTFHKGNFPLLEIKFKNAEIERKNVIGDRFKSNKLYEIFVDLNNFS